MKQRGLFLLGSFSLYIGFCSFTYVEKHFAAVNTYQEGTSVMPLQNGNYLVSGATNHTGNLTDWKGYLLMLNGQGDTVWTKKALPLNGKVRATIDGNFIYAGGNVASLAYDTIYITKADENGNTIWHKQIFYPICHNTVSDILPLANGNYLITGYFASKSCSNPTYDSFIMLIDANGNKIWDKVITGAMNQELFVLRALPDGNYAAFGWSSSNNENYYAQFMLVKFTPNGDLLWTQYYGNAAINSYGYGMDVLPDGGFVLLGYDTNMQLIRTNADGLGLWKQTYGTACGSTNFKVSHTTDGGLALLGSENTNGQCTSVFIKTDINGNLFWKKSWNARLREFQEKANGSFVITGYANYLPDVAVILLDTLQLPQQPDTVTYHQLPLPKNQQIGDLLHNATTGIGNQVNMNGIKLYPNPSMGNVEIEFENSANNVYHLNIYAINGQLVKNITDITNNKVVIERQNLPAGVYVYQLISKVQQYTGKFMLQ